MQRQQLDLLLAAAGGAALLVAVAMLDWWVGAIGGADVTWALGGWHIRADDARLGREVLPGAWGLVPRITQWTCALVGASGVAVGVCGVIKIRLPDAAMSWIIRLAIFAFALALWRLIAGPPLGWLEFAARGEHGLGVYVALGGAAVTAFGVYRVAFGATDDAVVAALTASAVAPASAAEPSARGGTPSAEPGRFTGISGPAGGARTTGTTAAPPVAGTSGTVPPPLGRARPVKHIAPIEIDFGADEPGGADGAERDPFAPPPERRR